MKKHIIANWKMNPQTLEQARTLFLGVEHRMHLYHDKAMVTVCAPFVFLPPLSHYRHYVRIGAQNVFFKENGAFTGEISIPHLANWDVEYVILGHSERRIFFDESDEYVRLKVEACLNNKLTPVVCLGGDSKATKDAMKRLTTKQFNAAVKGLEKRQIEKIIFVYEPTWAISTIKKAQPATGEHAAELIKHIRGLLGKHVGLEKASNSQILYGGSVNKSNVHEFAKHPGIDGALVGAASLNADDFISIIKEFHRESIHKVD